MMAHTRVLHGVHPARVSYLVGILVLTVHCMAVGCSTSSSTVMDAIQHGPMVGDPVEDPWES